ncbi:MAG: tetratricopeptide repeat protein [Alphaproteobacteria bacterium]|nr:tetratricopeptide repeat protein [Alphaproteobacteria bacterium]
MTFIIDGTEQQAELDTVIDCNSDSFKADVIEESVKRPVIVSFLAPWCSSCKNLCPLLEKHVMLANGAVRLVKLNIETNQQLAAQMRVQSVPTVIAFVDGKPVDVFTGMQPETKIRDFIWNLTGNDNIIEVTLAEAKRNMESNNTEKAVSIYQEILNHDKNNPKAISGILHCNLKNKNLNAAKDFINTIPQDIISIPEITSAISAVELMEQSIEADSVKNLQKQLETNPKDQQIRFNIAMAMYAENNHEGAVNMLLEIVRMDKDWNNQAARKQLIKLFEAFGSEDPFTISSRRTLTSLLFS